MPAPHARVDPLTGLQAARHAVYVHFPYCLSKCPYCDFASIAAKVVPEARYAQAVVKELELRGAQGPFDAVYFGGGTPSLWAAEHVASVLEALRARGGLAEGAEVTLEANPGASDEARFSAYRQAGVNRLSIGVQSLEPSTLSALGRAHSPEEAKRAFRTARAAGFDNVSLDLIYGVHGQRLEQAVSDAEGLAALGAEHLSAYALTLDKESLAEEVPLARQLARGEVSLPPDAEVVAMQVAVETAFGAAGLLRYEVSNYAKPGFHSRHNAVYWTGGEYLGVGAGATGFRREGEGGVRWSNHRSADKWLAAVEAGRLPHGDTEALSAEDLASERIAMGLRLVNGVDVGGALQAFGRGWGHRDETVKHLVKAGLLEERSGRLALTARGFEVHSAVAARVM